MARRDTHKIRCCRPRHGVLALRCRQRRSHLQPRLVLPPLGPTPPAQGKGTALEGRVTPCHSHAFHQVRFHHLAGFGCLRVQSTRGRSDHPQPSESQPSAGPRKLTIIPCTGAYCHVFAILHRPDVASAAWPRPLACPRELSGHTVLPVASPTNTTPPAMPPVDHIDENPSIAESGDASDSGAGSGEDSQLTIRIPNPKVYMARQSQWKGRRGKPRCDHCRLNNLKVSPPFSAFPSANDHGSVRQSASHMQSLCVGQRTRMQIHTPPDPRTQGYSAVRPLSHEKSQGGPTVVR